MLGQWHPRATVVVRWTAQIATVVVLCPAIAGGLFATFIPALQFGSVIEYGVGGLDTAAAMAPGAIYAGSSLLIVAVPMIASARPVAGRFFLLPDWCLGFILFVSLGMFLVFAAVLFPGFETSPSPRATLGHIAKLSLTAFTALVLAAGMILVRDGPPPADWRVRHQRMFLLVVPLIPAATAGVILGLAWMLR